MGLTKPNHQTIASIRLRNVTVEDWVVAAAEAGERFHFPSRTWWNRVNSSFIYVL
jgi:hypothetical protein